MTFSNYILDLLKSTHGGASDYQISKMLGVTRQTISKIRTGRNGFSDDHLIDIADLLGMDRVEVVARSHIQDDTSHNMRLLWSEILHRSDRSQALDSILKSKDEAA